MLGYTARVQELHLKNLAFAVTKWVGSPASIVTHSVLFVVSFGASWIGWIDVDRMLLVLTTIVSLEAIYLAIFIQMTLNFTTKTVEDISEDVEEISEDVAEIQEEVEDISLDVDEMTDEDASDDQEEEAQKAEQRKTLTDIQADLRRLMEDIGKLQRQPPSQ